MRNLLLMIARPGTLLIAGCSPDISAHVRGVGVSLGTAIARVSPGISKDEKAAHDRSWDGVS